MQPATSRGTLYTELGVPDQATPRQIRSAYLEKAKEIHPDRVPAGAEREVAERQMAHLNVLMGILGDEAKRAVYDLELKEQRALEVAGIQKIAAALLVRTATQQVPAWRKWGALAAGGFVFIVIGWVGVLMTSDARETEWWQARQKKPAAPKEPVKVIDALASAPKLVPPALLESPVQGERFAERSMDRAAERPVNRLAIRPMERPAAPRQPQASKPNATKLVALRRLPVPPDAPPPVQESRTFSWNGAWKAPSLELRMRNDGKKVHGSYKADIRTARLEFSFEGWADNPDVLNGVWVDPSGARGEFAAKKMEGTVVEMNWWTTGFPRKGTPQRGSARLAMQ